MSRPLSRIAPDWWDYTTLEPDLLADVAKLTVDDMEQALERTGGGVRDQGAAAARAAVEMAGLQRKLG